MFLQEVIGKPLAKTSQNRNPRLSRDNVDRIYQKYNNSARLVRFVGKQSSYLAPSRRTLGEHIIKIIYGL